MYTCKDASVLLVVIVLVAIGAPQAMAQHFIDNGNGTVSDTVNGLVWQQSDDGQTYTWHASIGEYNAATNPSSLAVCSNATTGGDLDWRLPSISDLTTLVDLAYTPTIDPVFSTQYPSSEGYWSATLEPHPGLVAAYINFDFGSTHGGFALSTDSYFEYKYVRCVRGIFVVHSSSFESGDFSGWSAVVQ